MANITVLLNILVVHHIVVPCILGKIVSPVPYLLTVTQDNESSTSTSSRESQTSREKATVISVNMFNATLSTEANLTMDMHNNTTTISPTLRPYPSWLILTIVVSGALICVQAIKLCMLFNRNKGPIQINEIAHDESSMSEQELPQNKTLVIEENKNLSKKVLSDSGSDQGTVRRSSESADRVGKNEDPKSDRKISTDQDTHPPRPDPYDLIDLEDYKTAIKTPLKDAEDDISQSSVMSADEGVYDNLYTAVQNRRRVDTRSVYTKAEYAGGNTRMEIETETTLTDNAGSIEIERDEDMKAGEFNITFHAGKLNNCELQKTGKYSSRLILEEEPMKS